MTTVERLWPGETFVCIGTGPSLTQDDVNFCRDKARVIAVNDAYTLAPWADVMYACDVKFWRWHKGAPEFQGLKYSLQATTFPDVQVLRNLGRDGLSLDPTGVTTGHNSVFQSVGLAVLLGAKRICLLGVDMRKPAKGPSHFFGEHPDKSQPQYAACLKDFATLVDPLKANGIEIVNCTPGSALTCFPMARLQDVLPEPLEAAS